jgi:two-component system response regulator HydG
MKPIDSKTEKKAFHSILTLQFLHSAYRMRQHMGSTSVLSIIRKLNEEFDGSLEFLNRELSFAKFAIAKTNSKGELPKELFTSSQCFPAFDPRMLEQALTLKQSVVEPLNQVFIVPCIFEGQLVGVLFASHLNQKWIQSEMILIELAATELARILAPVQPGLTLGSAIRSKTKAARISANQVQMIGNSEKLEHVSKMIERVAPTTASVLILGESGTGKELIAKKTHALSPRKEMPFVAINCGAITESLLESELFGHEKGAFTGAVNTKKGLVEIANGGTLFLDEIGEMALSLQAKLLRFLQEGEIYRVGGKEAIHVDVRILSATNRDLESEARTGKFREDLYYRLNTITLKSPALRERKEDIATLIEHFAPGLLKQISKEAMNSLQQYPWPGNIRELQNAVERMRILSGGTKIELSDLPLNIRNHAQLKLDASMAGAPPVEMPLEDLERIHILRCLGHFEGNKTRAAQSLGITIKTLYNKLHRYGILDKSEANL